MPQIIIGSINLVTKNMFDAIQKALPPNVYFIRQKSGWNNATLMVQIIKAFKLGLLPIFDDWQPVLILDGHRLHISDKVVRACNIAEFYYILVPIKMTWMLQPADTHVFARYKYYFETRFDELRISER